MQISPISFGKVIKLKTPVPYNTLDKVIAIANGDNDKNSQLARKLRKIFNDKKGLPVCDYVNENGIYLLSGKDAKFCNEKKEEFINDREGYAFAMNNHIKGNLDGVLNLNYHN